MQAKRVTRRRHSPEFKTEVLRACSSAGVSVAAVAQSHGVNANLVHKWRRLAEPRGVHIERVRENFEESGGGEFIALQLPGRAPVTQPDIRVEIRRGANTITVAWPLQGASECAAWLREWLR